MDKVTPNLEHVPKRTYRREKGDIICSEVISVQRGAISSMVSEGQELFRITLTKEDAKLLMEDLYCGEYTGA